MLNSSCVPVGLIFYSFLLNQESWLFPQLKCKLQFEISKTIRYPWDGERGWLNLPLRRSILISRNTLSTSGLPNCRHHIEIFSKHPKSQFNFIHFKTRIFPSMQAFVKMDFAVPQFNNELASSLMIIAFWNGKYNAILSNNSGHSFIVFVESLFSGITNVQD